MPVSGFSGVNVVDPDYSKHPFYKGPSLIKYLDDLPLIKRESGAPVRFCVSKFILVKFSKFFIFKIIINFNQIAQKFKDMGMVVMGKLETGKVTKGKKLILMPNKKNCKVAQIWFEDNEVKSAIAGQNLKVC